MKLEELKQEAPFKWKIQSYSKDKTKVSCVAYMDSRYVQKILDEVCGMDNWQNEFYEVKGKVFCKIGIFINSGWVWKSDSGALDENDNVESETTSKGETSDAFKRAGVQWGIGRFLYEKQIQWITKEEYESNKYKLTEFINSKQGSGSKSETKKEYPKNEEEDNKEWFNNPQLEKLKESLDKFENAEKALETARAKYKVSKVMEENIRKLF